MRVSYGRADNTATALREKTFTGTVWGDTILPHADGCSVGMITFTPGGRTHWHRHDNGQVLIVIGGEGLVGDRSGATVRVRAGAVVHSEPGEVHWHGAAPDSIMIHIAVSGQGGEWFEPVSDEDYLRAAETAAYLG
jgi:quercetin dioxygenase-like cupin family protein